MDSDGTAIETAELRNPLGRFLQAMLTTSHMVNCIALGTAGLLLLGCDHGAAVTVVADGGIDTNSDGIDRDNQTAIHGLANRPSNATCLPPATVPEIGVSGLPQRLADTGCFDRLDPTRPLPALIPYDVNAPLWSDGATKQRWLALPDGARIQIKPDGDFDLPPGAVTIKTFSLRGRRIETRFFVRLLSGEWKGYTYEWNEAGTDATVLFEGSRRRPIEGGEWHYPTRGECDKCHTPAAGYSLGLEIAQLNSEMEYPGGRRANQLATWQHIGLFATVLPMAVDHLPALPAPGDLRAPLEARARAYLHANCSMCHRPEDVGDSGTTDLRFSTPLAATMACNVEPLRDNLGAGPEARIIAPGNPDRSLVVLRMLNLGAARMPQVASLAVDQEGVALLPGWIRALAACP